MRTSLFLILASASTAVAHPHIDSGPVQSNKTGQLVTFGISHGCTGKDTVKIVVSIPTGVTSVRAFYGPFGAPKVTKDGTNVSTVTWEKATYETGDNTYPQFTLRLKAPDAPFTSLQFNVEQTCRDATGDTVVDWNEATDANGKAAPRLLVVPPRTTGWNKYTLATAVAEADVPIYFGDAQIVWRGTSAYTSNAAVAAMITMTPGVTPLAGGLAVGDEIWVKY